MVRHVELIANVEQAGRCVLAFVGQSRRQNVFSGDSKRKRANFLIPHSWPGSWARYHLRRFKHTHTDVIHHRRTGIHTFCVSFIQRHVRPSVMTVEANSIQKKAVKN